MNIVLQNIIDDTDFDSYFHVGVSIKNKKTGRDTKLIGGIDKYIANGEEISEGDYFEIKVFKNRNDFSDFEVHGLNAADGPIAEFLEFANAYRPFEYDRHGATEESFYANLDFNRLAEVEVSTQTISVPEPARSDAKITQRESSQYAKTVVAAYSKHGEKMSLDLSNGESVSDSFVEVKRIEALDRDITPEEYESYAEALQDIADRKSRAQESIAKMKEGHIASIEERINAAQDEHREKLFALGRLDESEIIRAEMEKSKQMKETAKREKEKARAAARTRRVKAVKAVISAVAEKIDRFVNKSDYESAEAEKRAEKRRKLEEDTEMFNASKGPK